MAGPLTYDGHRAFAHKVRGFPEEIYSFDPSTHLYNLMWTALEDPGIGQLKKIQAVARIGEHLGSTMFSDLDYFFGSMLRISRNGEESYTYDPYRDQLTADQWDEIQWKDASYRERISMFLQALLRGGTNEGIAMAAEAACGWPCQVVELWRQSSDLGAGILGRLNHPKEFLVVPLTDTITAADERAIYRAVERLKPANTFCTVDEQSAAFLTSITIRHATSPVEFYEIRKFVAPANVPTPPAKANVWVKKNEEVEAPTFAHMRTQDAEWSLNESLSRVATLKLNTVTDLYADLASSVAGEERQWGPWREIERVDSPDNFPTGKYSGDPNRYDDNGNYVFAWASQVQYVAWLTRQLDALVNPPGAVVTTIVTEFMGENSYRLPRSAEIPPGWTTRPENSLAAPEITVRSAYYPGITHG